MTKQYMCNIKIEAKNKINKPCSHKSEINPINILV